MCGECNMLCSKGEIQGAKLAVGILSSKLETNGASLGLTDDPNTEAHSRSAQSHSIVR